ncbi:MAG: hypothetical protein ABMA00_03430, partial [Gemmatimonas sp.]
ATGMLVSPGLLAWSGTIRPYFSQQGGSGRGNGFDTRSLGLSLGGNLFASRPVSLAFNAHRSSGRLRAGVGSESDFSTAGGGGVLSWRNRWFPMMLDVSRRSINDSWTSIRSQTPILRNDVIRDVRLQAQSTKTHLLINQVNFRDRLDGRSYRALDGTLEHAFRWGTGSALNTTLQSGQREGSYPYDRSAVAARVLLHHTPRVTSDYHLQIRRGTSSGVSADHRASGATLHMQNRGGWSNMLSAAWNATQYVDNRNANALYSWRSQINRRMGDRINISGTVSASVENISQTQSGTDDIVVVDERHAVDDGRTFVLINGRIDTTTIILRGDAQAVVFLVDIDYRLVVIGTTVRVQVLPGSRLAVGDVVIASYSFRALRSGRHTVEALATDLTVGTNTLMFRGSESIRDASVAGDAQDARLLSGRDRVLGVTLRHRVRNGKAELNGQHSRRLASTNDFRTDEVRLGFAPAGSDRWQSNLGLRASKSTVAGEQLTLVSGDLALNWTASPTLRVLGTSEHWLWQPSHGLTERFLASALEVNWQFGRVESSVRYMFQRRTARLDNNQHRVTARLVRRF